jgi:hypothetical protein
MKDKPKLNFVTYVFMLYQSGLIALGKLENPITKKTVVDLEEVTGIIELLELIEEKTKGNLNSEESRTLSMLLSTLRMNFVEEANKKTTDKSSGEIKNNGEENPEVH